MAIGLQTETNHERDPFDDFLDTLNEPREVIEETPEEVVEIPIEEADTEEAEAATEKQIDPDFEEKKLQIAMIPAETVVDCIDMGFTSINTVIAKQQQEGATDEEKQAMKRAAANWLKESNVEISPGKMLMFLILMIYAPKTVMALQLRKANEENQRLQEENLKLKQKLGEGRA